MNLTLLILLGLLLSLSCHRAHTPVVVHVFRDRDGTIGKNIEAAISAIGLQQLRISDGSPIMIATSEFRSYSEGLATISKQQPDLAIFDSRTDLPAGNLGGTPTNLNCAPDVTCVGVIPSWTGGKEREASERVLKVIGDRLNK